MRYWVAGAALWLGFWLWEWSDCATSPPGWSWAIACPWDAPVYLYSWGGFFMAVLATLLLSPAVAALLYIGVRRIIRSRT
jgi:hypothetical protein